MAKKVIIARLTHEGKQYVGKREAKQYDESSKVDDTMVADANVGLTLRVQRQIRDKLKENHGLKVVSTGGESVDLSNVEAV